MTWLPWGSYDEGPRESFGCVFADSELIFLIGGKRGGMTELRRCDIWNVNTKAWSSGPKLPIKMKYCRAVLVGRIIYVIGPFLEFYKINIDKLQDGWKRLPSLLNQGMGCDLVADEQNQYLYLLGDSMEKHKSFFRFHIPSKEWIEMPEPMKVGREELRAVYINGKIYAIGGRAGVGGDEILSSMSVYDVMKKTWTLGPKLPVPVYGHAVAEAGKLIFVCGGRSSYASDTHLSCCYIFDTETNLWSRLNMDLPETFANHAAVASNMNTFVIGGIGESQSPDSKAIYTTDLTTYYRERDDESIISMASTKATFTQKFFGSFCCKSDKKNSDF